MFDDFDPRDLPFDDDEAEFIADEPPPRPVEDIENLLLELGRRIQCDPEPSLRHPGQEPLPEWRGADVVVTSDLLYEPDPEDFMEGHNLRVRTVHALPLTWLFMELWDAFDGWLDFSNKYGFYGTLGQTAIGKVSSSLPESPDHRALLKAVLARAFEFLAVLRENEALPRDSMVVLHSTDSEGRQLRIDGATGEETA